MAVPALSTDSGFDAMLASNASDAAPPKKPKSDSASNWTAENQANVAEAVGKFKSKEAERDSTPLPTPPELKSAPKSDDYQTDPMQKFGSAGMAIAALGSLFTRKHLTNALKSGAAVNDAINAGDQERYKSAFEKWKVDNENAWKMADWQQSHYQDILAKIDAGEKGAEQELMLKAKEFEDPTLQHMIQIGEYRQHLQSMALNNQKLRDGARDAEIEAGYKAQGLADYAAAHPESPKPTGAALSAILQEAKDKSLGADTDFGKKQTAADQKAAYKEGYDKEFAISHDPAKARLAAEKSMATATATISGKGKEMSPEEFEAWKNEPKNQGLADAWAQGSPIADLMRGRGGEAQGELDAIERLAYERHPGLSRTEATQDYAASKSALNKFESGKTGDTVRSFNVAYAHADVLGNLIDALGNGDVQAINSAKQRFEQEFGSPAPTNFDAVKGIFADEINKAAVGGAGALGDREELRANIARNASPEQLRGAVDTYKSLIVGQLQGTERQYEQSTGRKDFKRFLSPEVQEDVSKKSSKIGLAGKPPDAKHIKMLKDDPSEQNKKYFDEAFGEGAAAKALGK